MTKKPINEFLLSFSSKFCRSRSLVHVNLVKGIFIFLNYPCIFLHTVRSDWLTNCKVEITWIPKSPLTKARFRPIDTETSHGLSSKVNLFKILSFALHMYTDLLVSSDISSLFLEESRLFQIWCYYPAQRH